MMKTLSALIMLLAISNVFAETVECHLVGGIPAMVMVKKFSFERTEGANTNFKLSTTKGDVAYSNVECAEENIPDPIYSCVHDKFVMILGLDEKPLKAVINPFVFSGKEYGPFFYLCK